MIEKDDLKEYSEDLLNKYFPEKTSKERGEAIMLLNDMVEQHKEIIKQLYVRKPDTKKDEGENGTRPVLPTVFPRGDTPRSRMPGGNDANFQVGNKLVPKREK